MSIDSSSWTDDQDGDIDENEDEEAGAGRGAQTTLVPVVSFRPSHFRHVLRCSIGLYCK